MMSKLCLFYATRDDLLEVMESVEHLTPLKYVRFGTVTKLPPESFDVAVNIPNLGKASHPSAVGCEKFLVCDPRTAIQPRQLETLTQGDSNRSTIAIAGREYPIKKPCSSALAGLDRYAIDQLANPDTITFTPGGLWKDDVMLHGSFGTASNSPSSRKILSQFCRAVASQFTKVKAYYVGRQALAFLKDGKRLTIAEQSPSDFDLAVE
jgi:hypothetical protein